MTLAAGIQIGAGVTPAHVQGKLASAAIGAGDVEAASHGFFLSTAAGSAAAGGTQSFREGLQSLLATLGSTADGFSQIEPETDQALVGELGPVTGSGAGEAAIKPSVATATPAGVRGLSLRQGLETGSDATSVETEISPAAAGVESSLAWPTAQSARTASSNPKDKQLATEPKVESAKDERRSHSAHESKTKAAAAEVTTDAIPAAFVSFSQPVPAVAVTDPAAGSTTDTAQAAPANLSAPNRALGTSTRLASASPMLPPLKQEGAGTVPVAERATSNQAADADRRPARDGEVSPQLAQVSPSLVPAEPPSPAFNRTKQPDGRREEPAATRTVDVKPLDRQAPDQPLSAASAPSRISSGDAAPAVSLVPAVAPVQEPSSAIQKGQGGTSMPSAKSAETSFSGSIANEAPERMAVAASTPAAPSSQPAPVPAVAAKSKSYGNEKSSQADALRPTRETGKTGSNQQGSRIFEGQSPSPTVDALAMARDGTGVRGAMATAGGFAGASTAEAAGPDPREAFAAIDAGSTEGKPTWIHAGMQRAEAGFQDPALGWVGVRADTSGGGVHAQLVPGSADAAQALGGHLAGLNAYLAAHHTPVETVTLTAPESGWTGGGGDQSQSMQQGAGQQTGEQAAQGGHASSPSDLTGNTAGQPAASEAQAIPRELEGSRETARAYGGHISVMA